MRKAPINLRYSRLVPSLGDTIPIRIKRISYRERTMPDPDWKLLTSNLLNVARGDTDWIEFADALGEDFRSLQKMAWKDDDKPRKSPTRAVRDKLLFYCEQHGIRDEPYEKLRALAPKHPKARGENTGLVDRLGLHFPDLEEAVLFHAGKFLFFLQNEDGKVIVCECALKPETGSKSLPEFEVWRNLEDERRRVSGVYYATENHLFMSGNRQGHRDLRLTVFRVERPAPTPDGRTPPQSTYKGLVTGVSWTNSIFSSRCAMVRMENAKRRLQELKTPIDAVIGERDMDLVKKLFPRVATYLTADQKGGVFFLTVPE
jgi:hypothetical protein